MAALFPRWDALPVSRLSPAWARPSALAFYRNTKGCLSPLLPLFAVVALLANALGWLSHRQWYRSLLGMVGPAIVLAAMLLFFGNWWTANLLYVGLALMIGVSIWDLLSPANRRCELPPKHG